jgi:hypothetical protein
MVVDRSAIQCWFAERRLLATESGIRIERAVDLLSLRF